MPRWKAAELAARKTTRRQAVTRILHLRRMIRENEARKAGIDIRILKHRKEIRLLEEAWDIKEDLA